MEELNREEMLGTEGGACRGWGTGHSIILDEGKTNSSTIWIRVNPGVIALELRQYYVNSAPVVCREAYINRGMNKFANGNLGVIFDGSYIRIRRKSKYITKVTIMYSFNQYKSGSTGASDMRVTTFQGVKEFSWR